MPAMKDIPIKTTPTLKLQKEIDTLTFSDGTSGDGNAKAIP
jgi:hypothetical protein